MGFLRVALTYPSKSSHESKQVNLAFLFTTDDDSERKREGGGREEIITTPFKVF